MTGCAAVGDPAVAALAAPAPATPAMSSAPPETTVASSARPGRGFPAGPWSRLGRVALASPIVHFGMACMEALRSPVTAAVTGPRGGLNGGPSNLGTH